MGTFFEDWSPHPVGSGAPSGYTVLFNSAWGYAVENQAFSPSGKALKVQAQGSITNPAHNQVLIPNAVTATGDYEVVVLSRPTWVDTSLNLRIPAPVLRADADGFTYSSPTRVSGVYEVRVAAIDGLDGGTPGFRNHNQGAFAWVEDANYWVRVRVDGANVVRTKVWAQGDSEPSDWMWTQAVTDRIKPSGAVGIGHIGGDSTSHYILQFGVGWGGEPAPLSADAEPAVPEGLTVTQEGEGLRASWTSDAAEFVLERERWTGTGNPS